MYCLFILSNLYTINKCVLYYLCCVKYYIHVTVDYINIKQFFVIWFIKPTSQLDKNIFHLK